MKPLLTTFILGSLALLAYNMYWDYFNLLMLALGAVGGLIVVLTLRK